MLNIRLRTVNENITKGFVAWLMKTSHVRCRYLFTTSIVRNNFHRIPPGHRFSLYIQCITSRLCRMCRCCALVLSYFHANVAYDPFRCNRLCFSHLSCENPAAMQEGWVLFIHLFKIALFIERVAGEWRLIDGHKNCGIIKTAQRSFSLFCGAFIHL